MRSYRQYCGLAKALDVVGDRWTLLIVRELLIGEARYSDLLKGLPGIATNLLATRLGQTDPNASRTQWLWAAALSRPLNERWGVVGEFSGTRQQGAGHTSQFLLAASYNLSKRLTLDAGAARSLRSGPPVWSAFTGFTWLAARLF